ncbi:MAG: hypothetical protein HY960_13195 [Ignavibacteriae bacterium]|nr:hypothetical protein [Ignavibacteriota bacterium]
MGLFIILLLLPLQTMGQYYNIVSSEQYLRSGIILGSERETYQSYRVYTLGSDFANFIEDDVSDLYRNPANFNTMKQAIVFGEYEGNFQRTTPSLSKYFNGSDYYPYYVSEKAKGVRVGYADSWGVMLRLKHASSDKDNNSTRSDNITNIIPLYMNIEQNDWKKNISDVQLSYAFPLQENTSLGFSYSFVFDETPTEHNQYRLLQDDNINSTYVDTSYEERTGNSASSYKNSSHIFRSGLQWKKERAIFDVTGTIERMSLRATGYSHDINNSWRIYHYTEGSRNGFNQNEYDIIGSGLSNTDATIIKLNFRYKNIINERNSIIASFDGGLSSFNAEEQKGSSYKSIGIAELSTDTSYSYNKNILNRISSETLSPDGTGYFLNGGLVYQLSVTNAHFLIGVICNFAKFSYDYPSYYSYIDTSIRIKPDTTIITRQQATIVNNSYQRKFGIFRVSIPVGIEYKVVEDLTLRGGWYIEYFFETDQNYSEYKAARNSTNDMYSSIPTIGFGWEIIEGLQADFINTGSITESRDWVMALQYKF